MVLTRCAPLFGRREYFVFDAEILFYRTSHRLFGRIHHARCIEGDLVAWVIPSIIAFLPFLIATRFIGKILHKKVGQQRALLAYYVIAGSIGLMIEWFIIGLSPWNSPGVNPLLILIFQLGIFSFWGTVAFAPQLLLDRRASVAGVRKWYKRFLILGYVFIYFVTLSATRQTQFILGIASVLLIFNLLNFFHFRYVQISGRDG